ncbi:hypothetical protein ACFOZY_13350 [Chungangia koreensis]|uniref:Lipoprotein n=1 Tax=Chungangia koreensis TaxID=752657 RepID=A0ABV8X8X2_9LACT
MKRFQGIGFVLLFLLAACSPPVQTVPMEKVIFSGEGDEWKIEYQYDPAEYAEKKVNWVQLEPKTLDVSNIDLSDMDIEFKSRDGVITGNVGGMKTKIEENTISFLVGTVNFDTYEEDEFQFTVIYKDQRDDIKLKLR